MTEIYIADIRCLVSDVVFVDKLRMLPQERQERITRYQKKEDRMRGLGAGLLLEYGLRCHGFTLLADRTGKERKKVELIYGAHGKPYLSGETNLYFNLSHSGDYVAAAFSSAEVGVDIERIREMKPSVVSRFFHPKEREYVQRITDVCPERTSGENEEGDIQATELWTRKESYIKAVGDGLSLPLDSFSVLGDKVGKDDRYCLYSFSEPEGYCLSVCGQIESRPEIVHVDLRRKI